LVRCSRRVRAGVYMTPPLPRHLQVYFFASERVCCVACFTRLVHSLGGPAPFWHDATCPPRDSSPRPTSPRQGWGDEGGRGQNLHPPPLLRLMLFFDTGCRPPPSLPPYTHISTFFLFGRAHCPLCLVLVTRREERHCRFCLCAACHALDTYTHHPPRPFAQSSLPTPRLWCVPSSLALPPCDAPLPTQGGRRPLLPTVFVFASSSH
jgi:hypothetical protein